MRPLHLDIWSDLACPWCFVGKRRLEAAIARFEHAGAVTIRWRSFELDPRAPRVADAGVSYVERLARKYRASVPHAQAMIDRMVEMAREDGIEMRFDRIRPGNTFDAHRLVHLGHARGIQDAVKERLLRAYLCEGEPIGDPDALARLAADAGLDAAEAREVLASDRFGDEVRADERAAHELEITGVPFFLLAGRFGVPGAQPADTMLAVLRKAWQLTAKDREDVEVIADGAACGPAGCDPDVAS